MFRNTLAANTNNPVRDCENLPSPIQMQLSLRRKTFSDIVLPFLESTSNFKHFEKKGSKLLQKEHERIFIIFFHPSERTWFGKYFPQWYVKSYECFVTHWLPMTNILFTIMRISRPRFKCHYLKNDKFFAIFSSISGI